MKKRNNYCAKCASTLILVVAVPFFSNCAAADYQPIVLNPPAHCLLNNCEKHADEPPRDIWTTTASSSANLDR